MTATSDYGTVVNCLGGTAQIPVLQFLQSHWGVARVDVITEAGPERILAEGRDAPAVAHLHRCIHASLLDQRRQKLAIAAHSGCDISIGTDDERKRLLRTAVDHLKKTFPQAEVLGVWLGADGRAQCV